MRIKTTHNKSHAFIIKCVAEVTVYIYFSVYFHIILSLVMQMIKYNLQYNFQPYLLGKSANQNYNTLLK